MRRRENDLGCDPTAGLLLRLAIPTMLAQFINVLYSIVDRMFIGHIAGVGSLVLAEVGVCGPIVTLLFSFSVLVGLGGTPLNEGGLFRVRPQNAAAYSSSGACPSWAGHLHSVSSMSVKTAVKEEFSGLQA